jgi:POT family proton-dependent oligopeptide transporter
VRIASLMMAIWFVSTAIANYFAGKLHGWLEHADINLWTFLMLTSFVPGIILLALTPVLKKMAHGRL